MSRALFGETEFLHGTATPEQPFFVFVTMSLPAEIHRCDYEGHVISRNWTASTHSCRFGGLSTGSPRDTYILKAQVLDPEEEALTSAQYKLHETVGHQLLDYPIQGNMPFILLLLQ